MQPKDGGALLEDEDALLHALRRRDERAFASLLERYTPTMLRAAIAITGNRAVAEEAVQEAWLAVVRGLDRFEGRASLRTWIFAIVLNQARSRAARESKTVPFSALSEPGVGETAVDPSRFEPADHPKYARWWKEYPTPWSVPDDSLLAKEVVALVEQTIARLPPNQRLVITLRDLAGYRAHEVCSILDIGETNQRVLLHRARTRVRGVLEHYFIEERGE